MRLATRADLVLSNSKHAELFQRMMSKGARDTLCSMVDWGCGQLQYFNNDNKVLLDEFVKSYSQIRFEEAEQTKDTEQYVKLIVGAGVGPKKIPGFKPKTADDVIRAMSLDLLFDNNWAHSMSIQVRNRVGDITQAEDLYNWITSKFVLTYFTKADLGKIADMAKLASFEYIKDIAMQPYIINDRDRRHIAYLYEAVVSRLTADQTLSRQSAVINRANDTKLGQLKLFAEESNYKIPIKPDPDFKERSERDREYIDILRDLDN
jgi:hypothetical protein